MNTNALHNGRFAILAALLIGIAGCDASLNSDYVKADRQTKTAVDPKLNRYAAEHPDEAGQIQDLQTSWEKRLTAAEAK